MRRYIDLIDQAFELEGSEFKVKEYSLFFNDIPLEKIIAEYGTPLRINYLPKIRSQVKKAQKAFNDAIEKYSYEGEYIYCYCTKSSHFRHSLEQTLKSGAHIETSSTYDIDIIKNLFKDGLVEKNTMIVCNGFKRDSYKQGICDLINRQFTRCYPVLDTLTEIDYYVNNIEGEFNVGIRCAADEESNFDFYTSRLGIRYNDIVGLCKQMQEKTPQVKLKLLHFFINSGIRDTEYYWSELSKFIYKYCELKKICPELDTVDIGGGFPVKYSLDFSYDYEYMAEQIIENIQSVCKKHGVPTPNLVTEFGSFSVAESGAMIFKVLAEKQQNDKELWYMIDGSLMTHLPDTWGKSQKFILLAINNWENEYHRVNIGGQTCDSDDYYNFDDNEGEIFLPKIEEGKPQYIGFFHTGAYQESLAGYGGIQHCLIPNPKHILIDYDENGELKVEVFRNEQKGSQMMKVLGYI